MMVRKSALVVLAVAIVASAMSAGPATATEAQRPGLSVVRTTSISGFVDYPQGCRPSHDENTAQLAVDPRDPSHLVASYVVGVGAATVLASSTDGGASWVRSLATDLTGCGAGTARQGLDPDLAIGPDGTVWATEGFFDNGVGKAGHDAVREYASGSRDGSTAASVDVAPDEPLQRGWVSVEPDQPGTAYLATERADYAGTYLVGSPLSAVTLRATTDGGQTWSRRGTIMTPAPGHFALAGGLERAGDTLVAIVHDVFLPTAAPALALSMGASAPGTAVAFISNDRGATWVQAGTVGVQAQCCLLDTASAPDGAIYVTWPQPRDDGGSDVLVSRSTDLGRSWQTSVAARSEAAITTTTAVAAGRDGRVGVFWYSPAEDADRPQDLTPRLTVSRDAGVTWLDTVQLAPSFDPGAIATFNDTGPTGPYQDIVALPDGFGVALTVGGRSAPGDTADVLYVHAADGCRGRGARRHTCSQQFWPPGPPSRVTRDQVHL